MTELLLTDSEGQQLRTFADKEGWFALHDVNPGTYVLTTYNPMFVYPEVGHSMQQQQQPLRLGLMHTLQKPQQRSTHKFEKQTLHATLYSNSMWSPVADGWSRCTRQSMTTLTDGLARNTLTCTLQRSCGMQCGQLVHQQYSNLSIPFMVAT